MAFSGKPREISLEDALELIYRTQKTGAFKVSVVTVGTRQEHEKTLYFKNGFVIAPNFNKDDNLSTYFLQKGYLIPEQINNYKKIQQTTYPKETIDGVLIKLYEDKTTIIKALRSKIVQDLYMLVSHKVLRASFDAKASLPKWHLKKGINPNEILLRIAKQKDELEKLQTLFPSHSVPMLSNYAKENFKKLELCLDDWRILMAINGEKNLKQLQLNLEIDAAMVFFSAIKRFFDKKIILFNEDK